VFYRDGRKVSGHCRTLNCDARTAECEPRERVGSHIAAGPGGYSGRAKRRRSSRSTRGPDSSDLQGDHRSCARLRPEGEDHREDGSCSHTSFEPTQRAYRVMWRRSLRRHIRRRRDTSLCATHGACDLEGDIFPSHPHSLRVRARSESL
jgi:hypothetical protein